MEDEVIELLFEEFGEDAEVIVDGYDLEEFDTAQQAANYIAIREEWRSQPVMDRHEAEYEERVLLGEEDRPRR